MSLIEINGSMLEIQVIPAEPLGTAPTLVFLHEGLGSVSMWDSKQGPWPQHLCQALQAPGMVYSRLGYGQSDPIADVRGAGRHGPDYMHIQAWRVLPRLLQQLGIQRPVLVGHSDGATIALLYAAQFPVSACVALAPHVMVEDLSIASIQAAREAYEDTDLRQRLSKFHAHVDVAFWQWCDVWLSQAFQSFDIRSLCQLIRDPVLAIQGRDDAYGTLAQIHDIQPAGVIQRLVLEHCGHSPHKDQREAVTTVITAFLQQQVPALRS
jgi:pimeloyl-ACP methyl ester carboxylesterase